MKKQSVKTIYKKLLCFATVLAMMAVVLLPSVKVKAAERLYISGYGYGYAGDTGSAIKGDRIDLGVNNAQEEKSWMFREVTVYILEKSNTW